MTRSPFACRAGTMSRARKSSGARQKISRRAPEDPAPGKVLARGRRFPARAGHVLAGAAGAWHDRACFRSRSFHLRGPLAQRSRFPRRRHHISSAISTGFAQGICNKSKNPFLPGNLPPRARESSGARGRRCSGARQEIPRQEKFWRAAEDFLAKSKGTIRVLFFALKKPGSIRVLFA